MRRSDAKATKDYSAELKAPIALEAIKGQQTMNEIAGHYGVNPNQVMQWQKQALTVDGSEANAAALRSSSAEHGTAVIIRRGVQRVTHPMPGVKSFERPKARWSASSSCT